MPIYPNFELLAAQNKEKIEAIENILNKGQAKKEIKRLIKLIEKAEDSKNYNDAILYLEKILRLEKKFLGELNSDLADTYSWLAEIYRYLNLYQKAQASSIKALEIRKSLFGINHKETSNSMINLALIYLLT